MNPYVLCEYITRNINSKTLLSFITSNIIQTCDEYIINRGTHLDRDYDFDQLNQYIDMLMEDIMEDGKITHYNVVCDDRNNQRADVKRGIIKASISFKQLHCLNTSSVHFTFTIPQKS